VDPLLVGYLLYTAVLVLTPGSTTAVVVRNTFEAGARAGLTAAAGAALGNASHAAAAGLGVALVFARWPVMMTALRLAGASYLAWLGATSLYRVVRYSDGGMPLISGQPSSSSNERPGSFRQGLIVNLLNPAIAAFYLLVVPSFIRRDAPAWYFTALAAAHIGMAFTYHALWALGLDRLRGWFRPPLARRALEGATGLALLGLAARILFSV